MENVSCYEVQNASKMKMYVNYNQNGGDCFSVGRAIEI